jgi:cell division protein FtsZ
MSEMGKAMMGTGEADGDNRAIAAAEQAIANPLLDGVSMRGAKGVIISITGGEDMRLMEVDEAANHIKELVDPDANIIWGSAFNNDSGRQDPGVGGGDRHRCAGGRDGSRRAGEGLRISGPCRSRTGSARDRPAAAQPQAAPRQPEPEPMPEPVAEAAPPQKDAGIGQPAEEEASDELLLGEVDIVAQEDNAQLDSDTRTWVAHDEQETAKAPAREGGGTLFERMSNIARGAAKAQVEDEGQTPRLRRERDPLDIPRFLNRQNNQ